MTWLLIIDLYETFPRKFRGIPTFINSKFSRKINVLQNYGKNYITMMNVETDRHLTANH